MSDKTMDLYLIQSPEAAFPDEDNVRGYNRDLLRYFKNSVPIIDLGDFICRIAREVGARRRLIKKLVIGSHGAGFGDGYGYFHIGKTLIRTGDDKEINTLKLIARFFVKDADVYLLACQTGQSTKLLRKVSAALGGVRVHGYTDYITTTNTGPFQWPFGGVSVDDGTDDEGKEIVCLPGSCRVL
jgi:hypothetical protein